jgi:hypothetical protein
MSEHDSHRIIILSEAQGWPEYGNTAQVRYEINFGTITGDHVKCNLTLSTPDHNIQCGCAFYGIDILNFAGSLEALHETLVGSTRLCDWDGEVLLCFTPVNRGRGHIALGGKLHAAVHWTDVRTEDNFISPPMYGDAAGIKITFEGLIIDQSYLPNIIRDSRRFLTETGISTKSPVDWT